MKLADSLRKKCKKKGLGVSGGPQALFDRLKNHEQKHGATIVKKNKASPPKKKSNNVAAKPKNLVPFKGNRLSAAYYFYEVCKGKLSCCKPMVIEQADKRKKLKEIKLVNGKSGKEPRWVLVKSI